MRPSWSSPTSNCYYFFLLLRFEPKSRWGSAADRRARLHIASFSLCGGLSSKNSATSLARAYGLWGAVNATKCRCRRRHCSSSSSQPRHFEEAVAHTNGARYVGGAVCSERGRGLQLELRHRVGGRRRFWGRRRRRCWCLHHCQRTAAARPELVEHVLSLVGSRKTH